MVLAKLAISVIIIEVSIPPVNAHTVKYVTVKAIARQINDLTNGRVRDSFNCIHLPHDRVGSIVDELLA
jgi:hypothetical protein